MYACHTSSAFPSLLCLGDKRDTCIHIYISCLDTYIYMHISNMFMSLHLICMYIIHHLKTHHCHVWATKQAFPYTYILVILTYVYMYTSDICACRYISHMYPYHTASPFPHSNIWTTMETLQYSHVSTRRGDRG